MPIDPALRRFIGDLQRRHGEAGAPQSPRTDPALLRRPQREHGKEEHFLEMARAAGGDARRVEGERLRERLDEFLQDRSLAEAFLDPALPTACRQTVAAALREASVRTQSYWQRGGGFELGLSITAVDGALVDSGSLIWCASAKRPRAASLVVPVHLAIVFADQLTGDLAEWLARHPISDHSNITFITGPSKTADIEGVLVTGVHGPGELHIWLIEEQR
jgi:L-lactate dehydrogenase complex protein LldG